MTILGIDTSCDDTGIGIVRDGHILANVIASQIRVHQRFGGVVPEIASREHTTVIDSICTSALEQANLTFNDIDAIAATRGPGLIGALMVGYTYGQALAFGLGKPFYPVHHLEGHIASCLPYGFDQPCLALIASGGHTHIFSVQRWGEYQLLGATLDDAAGEAFDKCARQLGLAYPGGPEIEQLAKQGDPFGVPLSVPLQGRKDMVFSFSGLKTAVKTALDKGYPKADVAASFQRVAIEHLTKGVLRAVEHTGVRTLAVCGGVAQNQLLRQRLQQERLELLFPARGLSTDNGAMIAMAASRSQPQPAKPATAYWPLHEWQAY